jgi:hypothetical protein
MVEDKSGDDALIKRITATYFIEPEDVSDSRGDIHILIRPA